jgi:tripartite-type tricarboxylate transporter receptor subunit TctC
MTLSRRATLAAGLAAPAVLRAQSPWPDRPVRVIVPFAPGGAADILGRLLATHLQGALGRPFVVENRPGAGSSIGVDMVAKAAPDGHVIGLGNIASHAILPALQRGRLPYDALRDFSPVSLMAFTPCLLVVNPERLNVRSVAELVAHARANPDRLNFSSSGIGTSLHLAMELFMLAAGLRMTHVPFNGGGPALQALLAGTVDLSVEVAATAWPLAQQGRLRALAVTTPRRAAFAPDLATLSESFPGTEIAPWHGVIAPPGTPAAIVERLAAEVRAFLALPATDETMRRQTLEPASSTPAEFTAFIAAEAARFADVVTRANIRVEG